MLKVFPRSSRINEKGNLEIGGVDTVDLVREFGTPLFVYDENHIREQLRRYRNAFLENGIDAIVAYAGKAFLCKYMARIASEEGAYLDCVTGGEIYTALEAGFPAERIFFHGNNKGDEEIEFAIENGVGYFVLDSFDEIERLSSILRKRSLKQDVLVRITPGIVPKTHTYIQTGQVDSKFGFSLASGQAYEAVIEVLNSKNLELKGFHMHIGSQIFSLEPFIAACKVMADFCLSVKERSNYLPSIINLGGGLGVAYRLTDEPPSIEEFISTLSKALKEEFSTRGLSLPVVAIEPGRSIVANAAVTLYKVGTIKDVIGVRLYVSVDGGMSDNLRPMLYGAVYEAFIANKMNRAPETTVTIAGKHCENGDILIRDVKLPFPEIGDIVVVPVTGAYGYAMSNNYNRQPRPAVVFVKEGKATLAIKREKYEDLIRNEIT
ncbi:MAG: diaminopimelate decarboxylase [Actinobacteria bacterium]|nr:diaminopimelate decarboxylase [Actinomycetota bacterium]